MGIGLLAALGASKCDDVAAPLQQRRHNACMPGRCRKLVSVLLAMFTVNSSSDGARAGVLATPSGSIATPALLVYTHRGGVLNLTPDLLEKLGPEVQGLQIDALQL